MKRALPLLLLMPTAAWAHGGAHEVEGEPPGWSLGPEVVVPLLLAALLYAIGYARLRRRSEGGRASHRRRGWYFAAGWTVLAASLVSPLHEAGERSFTLHMIEHELIMMVAALLLALSRPLAVMLWAFPSPGRRALAGATRLPALAPLWSLLTDPIVATLLQAAALIAWHAPALFDRALGHEGWHIAQHLSFLVSALLFWWAMTQRRGRDLSCAACLFMTSLIGGGLGALMAFSSSPWYAGYAAMGTMPFGLSPEEDQQLAGLIMWIPGGMVHLGAALWLLARTLQRKGADGAAFIG